jgi:hypothetical protein
MHYFEYNEDIQHRTGELPLAYYDVDEHHPRYHMRMHWHRETELLRMRRGTLQLYADNALLEVHQGDLVVLGEGALHGGDAQDGEYECIVLDPYALLMPIEPCKQAMKRILGRTIHLKNSDTNYVISNNIIPNTDYVIVFKCTYIDLETGKEVRETIDEINITTKLPSISMKVTNTSFGNITYQITTDNSYKITSGLMTIYVNNKKYSSFNINIDGIIGLIVSLLLVISSIKLFSESI